MWYACCRVQEFGSRVGIPWRSERRRRKSADKSAFVKVHPVMSGAAAAPPFVVASRAALLVERGRTVIPISHDPSLMVGGVYDLRVYLFEYTESVVRMPGCAQPVAGSPSYLWISILDLPSDV